MDNFSSSVGNNIVSMHRTIENTDKSKVFINDSQVDISVQIAYKFSRTG
jgi:hypothetical protein